MTTYPYTSASTCTIHSEHQYTRKSTAKPYIVYNTGVMMAAAAAADTDYTPPLVSISPISFLFSNNVMYKSYYYGQDRIATDRRHI